MYKVYVNKIILQWMKKLCNISFSNFLERNYMSYFKYVYLLIASFVLATAVQAAPIEGHFLKTVDSPARSDSTGQFIKVGSNDWYVIAGSYPRNNRGKREANKHRRWLANKGFSDFLVYNSGNFDNLTDGLWVLMWGKFTQSQAKAKLRRLKRITRRAYIKRAE